MGKKRWRWAAALLLCLAIGLGASAMTVAASAETLTIQGDGVDRTLTLTRADLEATTADMVKHAYSVTNNYPTEKMLYREGVTLASLLKKAGLKDTARQIKMISSDGYARVFTVKELMKDTRYCFPPGDAPKQEVPVMIALKDSSESLSALSEIELGLTLGQRVRGEQNHPWFVKYLQTIEVGTSDPGQWEPATFTRTAGSTGVSVQLRHPDYDRVKLYYTTDGTDPTIHSKVYNISASYYQPQLNKPIELNKNAEIRAIAIGAGKADSAVATLAVRIGETGFTDLAGYDWARPAIEDLTKRGIIKGMSAERYAPAALLTRAQFATIMVLATGNKPAATTTSAFRDVKTTDWHCGYVNRAVELGLLKGYPDGTFQPNRALTREEMVAIVVRTRGNASDTVNKEALAVFANEKRISAWARKAIAYAESTGLLERGHFVMETSQGLSFNAQTQANRAEAAVVVSRLVNQ